jgi:hypothetical protein
MRNWMNAALSFALACSRTAPHDRKCLRGDLLGRRYLEPRRHLRNFGEPAPL